MDQLDRIEAYLNGTLPPAERAAFEREIAADPALAHEVAWHRRMEREFGDADKLRLRRQLAEIGAQYPSGDAPPEDTPGARPPRRPGPWLWGLLGLLIIGGLAWWWLPGENNITAPAPARPTPPPPTPVDTVIADTPVVQNDTVPSVAPPAPQRPAPRPRGFQPNAELDALTNEAIDPAFEFADAQVEVTRLPSADSVFLLLNGRVLTAQRSPQLMLELVTYRYPRGEPLVRLPVELREIPDESGVYAFGARREYALVLGQQIRLPEGSYYGIIRHEGQPVWVGRLRRTGF